MATPINIGPTGAAELVEEGFDKSQTYATQSFNTAITYLNDLTGVAQQLQTMRPVDISLGSIDTTVAPFVKPTPPAAPTGLEVNMPNQPADPTLTPITMPALGDAPEFTAQPPTLDIPDQPAPLSATVPISPTVADVTIPGAPDIVLPDVPTLNGINLPGEPLLNLPTFTAVLPNSPQAPDYIFAFAEPVYTSSLLDSLRAVLLGWVNGESTGLRPDVEQALWDRARSREYVGAQRKLGESIRLFGSRGFSKPPGALNIDIQQALTDTNNALSGLSRDIMIKQADLEQTNRKYAFDKAWEIEQGLIQYQNQIAQRGFDAAKYAQQILIDIYHENVQAYVGQVQAYAAQVDAYKAQLQGELSKLDVYKAELEAQKLIGDLNLQLVQIYTAEVEAQKARIDIFKAEVDAANTQAQVNKTIIEAYAAQVGAYAEQVRAKAAEYNAYATLVQAQVAKVDMFKAQADAYSAQVTGFKATVDAAVEKTNLAIKVGQDVPLDLFKTRADVFRTLATAETERVDALAKVYAAETQAYSAEVGAEASRASADVAVVRANTDVATANANVQIEVAKTNLNTFIQQVNLLVEAIRSGAQVAAQMASAALSSVNLSGQIGDHYSSSEGITASQSTSSATSQSQSTSSNTSQSQINSSSNATNTNYNYSN